MTRRDVALGAEAERARIHAADRDGVAWRRWRPVTVGGAVLAMEDQASGLRMTIEVTDGTTATRSATHITARQVLGTPTASFVLATDGAPEAAGATRGDGLLVVVTAAKRSPEDIVLRVDVTNAGIRPSTPEVGIRLAFRDPSAEPNPEMVVGGGPQPIVRAPWEAQDHDLPADTRLLSAGHPEFGTWWLTGTAGGPGMDALDDGTTATLRARVALARGESRSVRLRLCRSEAPRSPHDLDTAATLGTRAREAAAFGASLLPAAASDTHARASLGSLADVLWSSTPDATPMDRILGALALAVADPGAAQAQLSTILGDAHRQTGASAEPPIAPWAVLRVHELATAATGHRDPAFLEGTCQELRDGYSGWVDRLDTTGRNPLQGGILSLDGCSDSAEGTAWMACYTVWMLSMAIELARDVATYQDVAVTFLDSALAMIAALDDLGGSGIGLWDEADGRYRDVARSADGQVLRVAGASVVGSLPLLVVAVIPRAALAQLPEVAVRLGWSLRHKVDPAGSVVRAPRRAGTSGDVLISAVSAAHRRRALADPAAWVGDVPPAIACLLIDALDRLHAFDSDPAGPVDVQAALLARLDEDARGPAWATLLAGAMRRSR
ncbi:MAG: hypothetical protein LH650_05005 [Chloroflexi bacterium]|nr:hypothetical protein [Chloroflexota bacterium]